MMTETAKKYGGSLYELASEENQMDLVLEQLGTVLSLMKENPLYEKLLSEPSISKDDRVRLLDEAFGADMWPYLLNFLKLMCEKGYMGEVKGCAKEYRRLYNEAHGIVEATVTSAVALTDAQKKALHDKLEKMKGKRVDMTCYVNPALIGGIRLDMDGKRYDGTAKERIDALNSIIKDTVV